MTLRPESVKRMRRRVSRLMALEARGLRPPGTTAEAYAGWRANAEKGDSRLLVERCDRWAEEFGWQPRQKPEKTWKLTRFGGFEQWEYC